MDGEFNWHDENGSQELRHFLDHTIDNIIAPPEPPWLTDARLNLFSRPFFDLADTTAHHAGETRYEPRYYWHQDYAHKGQYRDYLQVSRCPEGKSTHIPMTMRKVHAAVGNAVLNMAIIPPMGYDGDLNTLVKNIEDTELPSMTTEERVEFDENIQGVAVGIECLKGMILEETVWPPVRHEKTDRLARVKWVRWEEAGIAEE